MQRLQDRFDGKVTIDRHSLRFNEAIVEGISFLGPADVAIMKAKAHVNVNPLVGPLGALDDLVLENFRARVPWQVVERELRQERPPNTTPSPPFDIKSLGEGYAKYLPLDVTIEQGDFKVIDVSGMALVHFEGVRASIESSLEHFDFQVRTVRFGAVTLLENLKGQIILKDRSTYGFIISNGAYDTERSWEMTGNVNFGLGDLKGFVKTSGLEPALSAFLSRFVTIEPDVLAALRFDLHYDHVKNSLAYWVQFGTTNIKVQHPLLAKAVIGPWPLRLKFDGSLNLDSGALDIKRGVVSLKDPKKRGPREADLLTFFDLSHPNAYTPRGDDMWKVSVRLPQTPCQRLIHQAPLGLVPALETFVLEGNVALDLDIQVPGSHPEDFAYQLNSAEFNCKVASSDFAYSRERLAQEIPEPLTPTPGQAGKFIPTFNAMDYAPLGSIAADLPRALVGAEDSRFWTHAGIDWPNIENALRQNLKKKEVTIGGSTITMQTVKNLWLTPERNISRKIQELFLTWHLERIASKRRILETYVNIIEFGPNVIGIKQAARHFFDKAPIELSLLESAYLATLLPSPIRLYSQFCRGTLSPSYRQLVHRTLSHMRMLGLVSDERYQIAVREELRFSPTRAKDRGACEKKIASYRHSGAL